MIAAIVMDAIAAGFFRADAVACDETALRRDDQKKKTPPKLSLGGVPVSNGKERLALLALFGLTRRLRGLSLLFRSHSINLPRHWDD